MTSIESEHASLPAGAPHTETEAGTDVSNDTPTRAPAAIEQVNTNTAAKKPRKKATSSATGATTTNTITVLTSATRRKRGAVTAVVVTKNKTPAAAPSAAPTTSAAVPRKTNPARAESGGGGAHPAHDHLARVTGVAPTSSKTSTPPPTTTAKPTKTTKTAAPADSDATQKPGPTSDNNTESAADDEDKENDQEEVSSMSSTSNTDAASGQTPISPPPPKSQSRSRSQPSDDAQTMPPSSQRTLDSTADRGAPLSSRSSESLTTSSTVSSSTQSGTQQRSAKSDGATDVRYKATLANLHAKRTKRSAKETPDCEKPMPTLTTSTDKTKKKPTKKVVPAPAAAPVMSTHKKQRPSQQPRGRPAEVTVDSSAASPAGDVSASQTGLDGVLARMRATLSKQGALFLRVDHALAAVDHPPTHTTPPAAPALISVPLRMMSPELVHVPRALLVGEVASVSPPHAAVARLSLPSEQSGGLADVEDTILSPLSPMSLSPQSHTGFSPTVNQREAPPSSGTTTTTTTAAGTALFGDAPQSLSTFAPIQTAPSPTSSLGGTNTSVPSLPGSPHTAAGAGAGAAPGTGQLPAVMGTNGDGPASPTSGPAQRSFMSVSPVSVSSSPSSSTTLTPSSILSTPNSFAEHNSVSPPGPEVGSVAGAATSATRGGNDMAQALDDISLSPTSLQSSLTSATPPLGLRDGRLLARGTPPNALAAVPALASLDEVAGEDGGDGDSARRWPVPPVRVVRRPPIAPVNRPSPLRKSSSHRSDSLYTTDSSTNSPTQTEYELYLRANARLEEEEMLQEQHRLQLIFEQQLRQCEAEGGDGRAAGWGAHRAVDANDDVGDDEMSEEGWPERSPRSPRSPQSLRVQVVTLPTSVHSRRYVRRRKRRLNPNSSGNSSQNSVLSPSSSSPPLLSGGRAASPQTDEEEQRAAHLFDSRIAELERFQAANMQALRGLTDDGATGIPNLNLTNRSGDGLTSPISGDDVLLSAAPGGVARRRPSSGQRGGRVAGGAGGRRRRRGEVNKASPSSRSTATGDAASPSKKSGRHGDANSKDGIVSPVPSTTPEDGGMESDWQWSPNSNSLSAGAPVSPGGTEVIISEPITDAALTAAKAVAIAAGFAGSGNRRRSSGGSSGKGSAASAAGASAPAGKRSSGSGSGGGGGRASGAVPPLCVTLIEEATDSHKVKGDESSHGTATSDAEQSAPGVRSPQSEDAHIDTDAAAAAAHLGSSGTPTPSSVGLLSGGEADGDAAGERGSRSPSHGSVPSSHNAGHGTSRTPRVRLARTPRSTSQPNMLGRRRSSAKMVALLASPSLGSSTASAASPNVGGRRGSAQSASSPMSSAATSVTSSSHGNRRRGPTSMMVHPNSLSTAARLPLQDSPPPPPAQSAPEQGNSPLRSDKAAGSNGSDHSNSPVLPAASQPTNRPPQLITSLDDARRSPQRPRSQTVIEKPKRAVHSSSSTSSSTGHANALAPSPTAASRPRRASMPSLPTSSGGWLRRPPAPTRTSVTGHNTSDAGASPLHTQTTTTTTGTTGASKTKRSESGAHLESGAPVPVRRRASMGDMPTATRPAATRKAAPTAGPAASKATASTAAAATTAVAGHNNNSNSTSGQVAPVRRRASTGMDLRSTTSASHAAELARRRSSGTDGVPSSNASGHSPPRRRGTIAGVSPKYSPDTQHDNALLPVEVDDDVEDDVDGGGGDRGDNVARNTHTPSELSNMETGGDDDDDTLNEPLTPRGPYRFPYSPQKKGADDDGVGDVPGLLLRRSRSASEALSPTPARQGEMEDATDATAPYIPPLYLTRSGAAALAHRHGPNAGAAQGRRFTYQGASLGTQPDAAASAAVAKHERTQSSPSVTTTTTSTTGTASGSSVSPSFLLYHKRLSQRNDSRTRAMEGLMLSDVVQTQILGAGGSATPLAVAAAMSSAEAPSVDSTAPPTSGSSPSQSPDRLESSPLVVHDDTHAAACTPPSVFLSGPLSGSLSSTPPHSGGTEEEGGGSGGGNGSRTPPLRGTAPGGTSPSAPTDRRRRLQTRVTPKPGISSPSAASAKQKS